MAMAFVLKIP